MKMIRSLQGLRAIGTLIIFLFHSSLFPGGQFVVTFFFMMSGFGIYYQYSSKSGKTSIIKSFKFAKKNILSFCQYIC